jgi:hypothetical protein
MSKRRPILVAIIIVLALCICASCVLGAGAAAYFWPARVVTGPSTGEFSGFYTSGFEVSSFIACGQTDEQWWLGADPATGFYDYYRTLTGSQAPGDYTAVFVRFRGNLTAPGLYGHLGAYSREVYVTDLLEMSLNGSC